MIIRSFRSSLAGDAPPATMPAALQALWWDAKGEWQRAHEVAQAVPEAAGAWVHAYLHRKEGDIGNARYWYRRAGKPYPEGTAKQEWEQILRTLLKDG